MRNETCCFYRWRLDSLGTKSVKGRGFACLLGKAIPVSHTSRKQFGLSVSYWTFQSLTLLGNNLDCLSPIGTSGKQSGLSESDWTFQSLTLLGRNMNCSNPIGHFSLSHISKTIWTAWVLFHRQKVDITGRVPGWLLISCTTLRLL